MKKKIFTLTLSVFVLCAAGIVYAQGGESLKMTRFGERDGSTLFLHEEAGMSAYAQVDSVDLEKAEEALKTVEKSADEYVIGSIGLADYDETHDVHIYVDSAGWVIAYYLAEEKANKIINWISYSTTSSLDDMKIKNALLEVCNAMQCLCLHPMSNITISGIPMPQTL